MKRSEMIKLMIETLDGYMLHDRHHTEEVSNELLGKMEEAGMLPPSFHCWSTGDHCTTEEIIDCANIDGAFEWEAE